MMLMFLLLISATVVNRDFANGDPRADSLETDDDRFELKPCSSEYFHKDGKCGEAIHGYFRCPKGYWCSGKGFCGTSPAHRSNPTCPRETTEDPDEIRFRAAPDDDEEDQDPVELDEPEDLRRYMRYPEEFCSSNSYHRWGKCGYDHHGNFRCRHGEWCSSSGYCGRTEKYRENAICPQETRPDPVSIEYTPAPDDDPLYYGPVEENANDGDQLLSDDQDDFNFTDALLQLFLNETNGSFQSDAQKSTSQPSSNQGIDSGSHNAQTAVPSTSTDDHIVELSSRFNMDQGEIPPSESSVGRVQVSRLSNLSMLLVLSMIITNL